MANSLITVPTPPLTPDVAASILGYMGAQSGVITDYNKGSQIRTLSQAIGSVVEVQSVENQALALQAMVYGAYAAYGIFPLPATGAVGTLTFATSFGTTPPPASQPVTIPAGTIGQTTGGISFITTATATLTAGSSSINVPIVSKNTGLTGNVAAGTIVNLVSSLTYPLQISNANPTTGGQNAELPSQTLARFTAKVASIGLASPVSIANAVIGVSVPSTGETVLYSTVYEPWVVLLSNGAGFTVYIDNGSGSASAALISQVTSVLNGNRVKGETGYRPAGVPYSVLAVSPVELVVTVTGNLTSSSLIPAATQYAQNAIVQYMNSLQFGQTAYQSALNAIVSNAIGSSLTNLTVAINVVGSAAATSVTATPIERIILNSYTINLT